MVSTHMAELVCAYPDIPCRPLENSDGPVSSYMTTSAGVIS